MDAETLRALLDFVSDQARAERESRHQRRSQVWVAIGVAIAAAASVVAATIQALPANRPTLSGEAARRSAGDGFVDAAKS